MDPSKRKVASYGPQEWPHMDPRVASYGPQGGLISTPGVHMRPLFPYEGPYEATGVRMRPLFPYEGPYEATWGPYEAT